LIDRKDLLELISVPFKLEGLKPRFIRVSSAHISGISYNNIREEGLELLKEILSSGLRITVPTTINPGFCELEEQDCDKETYKKQLEIIETFKKLGAKPTLSCIPYLLGNIPKKGDHIAWAESNAVLYTNSVIGAWSNKESGLTALASAILGITSFYGVHLEEGRVPKVKVNFNFELSDEVDAGLAGFVLGKIVKDSIPFVSNSFKNRYDLIEFLASVGTSGVIPLVVIEGITPISVSKDYLNQIQSLSVGEEEINKAKSSLENLKSEEDAILMGCPHLSLKEVEDLLKLNRKRDKDIFVFVPKEVKAVAEKKYSKELKDKNIKLVSDSCILWGGIVSRNYRKVVTNSVKGAYYLRNVLKVEVGIRRKSEIMDV
jgi:predicted aconitase